MKREKQMRFNLTKPEYDTIREYVPDGFRSELIRHLLAHYVRMAGGEWPTPEDEAQMYQIRRLFNTENG